MLDTATRKTHIYENLKGNPVRGEAQDEAATRVCHAHAVISQLRAPLLTRTRMHKKIIPLKRTKKICDGARVDKFRLVQLVGALGVDTQVR